MLSNIYDEVFFLKNNHQKSSIVTFARLFYVPEAATGGVLAAGYNFIKKETLAQIFSCDVFHIGAKEFKE